MSREIRVALVGGGGFMGRAHSLAWALAPIASDLGATVKKQVLVEAEYKFAAKAAAQLGWEESSDDWREVLKRDDIDIVDICTPPQFHHEIAQAAVAAGKHVFCEKPITNDIAEAEAMAAEALAAGVVTQVGFNYRHTPAIAYAKKLLEEGLLGNPLQFRASYLQNTGFGADPNRWRATKAGGGSGTVGDIGSHIIDIGEHLFGDIVRVCAQVRSIGVEDEGWLSERDRLDRNLIDDAAVWIAEFSSGAMGTFAVSSFASGNDNHVLFEFDTTRAGVRFDWNDREVFEVSYVDARADARGFQRIRTNDQHPDGWWRLAGLGMGYLDVSAIQFQKFIRAIIEGANGPVDFSRAARVQRVVEAVHRSAVDGAWANVEAASAVKA